MMDLPDCPPGAEGYQDSVTEVPKKPEDPNCTKAELEFQEHLNSLKIKLEDGSTRPMVERNGRDISGKWIYLCYPCAAVCSGESILQTHISGKKHKTKLAVHSSWPMNIFEPFYNQVKPTIPAKVIQKMANAVEVHNEASCELERKYGKYRNITCHIQEALDGVKAPLIGLEYFIEHPPEQAHYEPKYICILCSKQGHPRTIINHMTCFWHRYNYILRHFHKACNILLPYRTQMKYRDGVAVVINRLAQRIEDKYGRMRPLNIDKEEYEREKDRIHQWIFKGKHWEETDGCTFEEVVDIGLIDSLHESGSKDVAPNKKEPSPPTVAAPPKPRFNHFARPVGRQERRAGSVESLSDISDDPDLALHRGPKMPRRAREMFDNRRRAPSPIRHRYTSKSAASNRSQEKARAPNYEYKLKLASEKRTSAEDFAKKTLAYHEKNPEKHPLYPEEWKKFWNKRYKEIQAEGKDPSKHDFKPEWIIFWTARMKALHDEELRVTVNEIYRKMCLSPPDMTKKSPEPPSRAADLRRSADVGRRPDDVRRPRSPVDKRRRSPELRRRSPEPRRRSPDPRRRSPIPRHPEVRHRSPEIRHRSPVRRRSPDPRWNHRSPGRRSPGRRRSSERHRSPPIPHRVRTRSRSPMHRASPARGTRIALESVRRSRSPLSQREMQPRNRSPEQHARGLAPSLQTVLISDDELRPDDGLSPWNSDNEIGSVVSCGSHADGRSRAGSTMSRGSKARWAETGHASRPRLAEHSAPDDVVATLRLLVALEDYLGSLGPKLVDLLAEALKMEKEKANSSEELLLRESATGLMETAKEKLKGAAQAGLVTGSAASAARAAVVRAAATLHEADKRARSAQTPSVASTKSAVPVAGVGEVDRAQIARQMAAALIAQGKTDVSSEELAQLVDAVVGMAEAKKRESERRQPEIQPTPKQTPFVPRKMSGTASALQMLQSAYDEHDKRIEKEDTPDAMDGLSDSDLETLLKNFNELSAEEQHSLIAYLKKLEAREPTRVERLRQYVSDAAHAPAAAPAPPASAAPAARPPLRPSPLPQQPAPPQAPAAPVHPRAAPPRADLAPLVLESDDDDYTVEEVFQSATQKVKEDQIRQEMEIVKKSLEGTKPLTLTEPTVVPETDTKMGSVIDISRNISSASDLFALVQASLKSASTPTPAPIVQPPEVVTSNTQPRSFGDLPEASKVSEEPAKSVTSSPLISISLLPASNNQSAPSAQKINQILPNDQYNQGNPSVNDRFNQGDEPSNDHFNRDSPPSIDHFNQSNQQTSDRFNQGNETPNDRFNQGNLPPHDRFNQGYLPPQDRSNQGNQPRNDRFNQGNQSANDRFNQGNPQSNDRFNQGNQPSNDRFNQGNQPSNDRFNQGNQPSNDRFNQGNQPSNDRFNQGNQQSNDRFNQGNQPPIDHFNQGNQPLLDRFNQNNQPPNDRFTHGNLPPQVDRFNQGNLPPNDRFTQGNLPLNDRFNQGNPPPNDRFNQGNAPPNDRFNQGNQPPIERFNQGDLPSNDRFNQGNLPSNDRFNQGNLPPNDRFNQGNQPSNENFNQGNQGNQWNSRSNNIPLDIRGPPPRGGPNQNPRSLLGGAAIQNPRPLLSGPSNQNLRPRLGAPANQNTRSLLGGPDSFGPSAPYNQGPRQNFRGQDNRQMNQFGNYDNQNNTRGRGGRGQGRGGPMRGRGRGHY